MENFTPVASTLGGVLIGLAACGMLLFEGRIAGISGLLGHVFDGRGTPDRALRVAFVAGLVVGGVALTLVRPAVFGPGPVASMPRLVIAGLLVGVGTRLGNGCTSGHGVCGLARRSARSLAATCAFMGAGMVTVFVAGHALGGQP